MKKHKAISAYALRIALLYAVVGGLWIFLSDRLLLRAFEDVETLTAVQTYKGWLFVALSAVLIYFASRHYFREYARAAARLRESRMH